MTLSRSFVRNAATTPLDARLMLMSLITATATGIPRAGVLGASSSIVSTTGTMNLAVAAAEFVTTKGRADGVSIFVNDGVVNVPVTPAPVSNSRIDVLYVKHNDDTTGDANALPIFGVVAGAAAASPLKPAVPTGALELATLRIYAGTSATNGGSNVLTNTYAMTATRGGVVPFRTKAELDAWTTAANGQEAVVLTDGSRYERKAGAWTARARPLTDYDPNPVNLTLGNGTLKAQYTQQEDIVDVFLELIAGTTTSATGSVAFDLPVPAAGNASTARHEGIGIFRSTSGTELQVVARFVGGASAFNVDAPEVVAGYLRTGAHLSHNFPGANVWASGRLYLHFRYEAA